MKSIFRYNRDGTDRARPPRGCVRWLSFVIRMLARLLRRGSRAGAFLWAEDETAELLAAGFPSLCAVPAPLFAETAALFPGRCRLYAAGSEEELLAQLRRVEQRFGERFDWDAFLAACERQNRRAARLRSLSAALSALTPASVDARTPQAALRDLQKIRKETDKT